MIRVLADLLPLLIILYFGISGWKKGVIFMLVSLLRFFLSFLIAKWFTPTLTNLLYQMGFIRNQILSLESKFLEAIGGSFLSLFGTNNFIGPFENFSYGVLYAISFVLLFLLLGICFKLLLKGALAINDVPIVGWINHGFGLLLGLIYGLLIAVVVLLLVMLFLLITGQFGVLEQVSGSWIPELIWSMF